MSAPHASSRSFIMSALLLSGGLVLASSAAAQAGALALNGDAGVTTRVSESSALARGRYAVVIDLDENKLHFKQGDVTLWSADVGTGTGLRLETDDNEWDFSTPQGTFLVHYKEENPTWIAPDWYFIENDLPVPPRDSKRRFFPGGLGAAAVYIGSDLAIHGTDKPELLGQRVSHGCIRLSNADALRLYHNVQVGTEVVIMGGKDLKPPKSASGNAPGTFNPAGKPPPPDPELERWKRMSTARLLDVLEDELWTGDYVESRWSEVAGLLMRRALKDDDDALRGILLRSSDLPNDFVEREYRTYLADVYARQPLRTLRVLSRVPVRERSRIASSIVEGTLGLYNGSFDSHSAPWPTRRVSREMVSSDARRGWMAIDRAEREFRSLSERRSV